MRASAVDDRTCCRRRISMCPKPWPRFARQSRSTGLPRMPDWRAPFAPKLNCARCRTSKRLQRRGRWPFARWASTARVSKRTSLGTVLFLHDWDWAAADRSLRRALALDPAHTEGLVQYGALMEALGKLDEGLQFQATGARPQPTVAMAAGADRDLVLASAEAR